MTRRAKRTKDTATETTEEREEREARIRDEMRATAAARLARAAERKNVGRWCRVTGSRARCDNPKCGARGRGSLRVYRVATSEHKYDHQESIGPGGGVQHNTTQHTVSECTILCEDCKFRQMVQEHRLYEKLDNNQLPPMAEVIALTGVQLDADRYERLRVLAMLERASPTDRVVVPEIERRISRERRANQADDLEPLAADAVG
jgi:hypothetical protein